MVLAEPVGPASRQVALLGVPDSAGGSCSTPRTRSRTRRLVRLVDVLAGALTQG